MMNKKIGLGIIAINRPEGTSVLKQCIDSLPTSVDSIHVYGVNIDKPEFISNNINFTSTKNDKYCISWARNYLLRELVNDGCEYIFLMDDDLEIINKTIFEQYIEAAEKSGLWYLSYRGDSEEKQTIDYNDTAITFATQVNRKFCFYHKGIIKNVGFFDERYSNSILEQADYTKRVSSLGLIPKWGWFPDIENSKGLLKSIPHKSVRDKNTTEFKNDYWMECNWFKHKHGKFYFELEAETPDNVLQQLEKIQNNYATAKTNVSTSQSKKIKIITGYSQPGGSTVALSNLTNALNAAGYDATMYGPHDYHLGLCKGKKLTNETFQTLTDEDRVITHWLKLPFRPRGKVVLLSCHEKWWFDVAGAPKHWDKVVFLHQQHRDYHGKYQGPYLIIPNLKENLVKSNKEGLDKIGAVIGSIEDRKQTHVSIQRALNDGCEKVYLFGGIGDPNYYNNFIRPLLGDKRIIEYGRSDNKQQMYDMVGRVYHSSKGEVACLIKDECWLTGTQFFGNEETENEVSPLTNDEVIALWADALQL